MRSCRLLMNLHHAVVCCSEKPQSFLIERLSKNTFVPQNQTGPTLAKLRTFWKMYDYSFLILQEKVIEFIRIFPVTSCVNFNFKLFSQRLVFKHAEKPIHCFTYITGRNSVRVFLTGPSLLKLSSNIVNLSLYNWYYSSLITLVEQVCYDASTKAGLLFTNNICCFQVVFYIGS